MLKSILPYAKDFPNNLADYIGQITEAIKNNSHHDQRRHLFISFLRLGFDINPVEITLEKKIKVAEVRGRIDAFFKSTIFEFKSDIEKERPVAKIELKKYFESQPNPSDFLALLTDGLFFEAYQYKDNQIVKISEFKLSQGDPLASFRYLDQFIFASKPVKPSSSDIIQRFGLHSAVFNASRLLIEEMFKRIKSESSVKVKFKEWNTLLARVYGAELGDISLFIKHTYLTMFSRLLVAKTLFPDELRTAKDYKGLLTGEYFIRKNLSNLVEPDFFSWAIDTSEEEYFIGFLSKLEGYLSIYDLNDIREDVLKELYQELVDPESRHSLGEYYTPDWLAELTLEAIHYDNGQLLDPACGSGTFLFKAIHRKRQSGLKGKKLLEDVLHSIIGVDVHPLAVMMAKANMFLAINKEVKAYEKEIYLQVYLSDMLLVSEDIKKRCLAIPVTKSELFFIPLDTVSRDLNLDHLVDKFSSFAHKSADGINAEEAFKGLEKTVLKEFSKDELFYWRHNFSLMIKLIKQKRDSIWSFILKNVYRPAFLRLNKVDFIVGNPPWLAYRYIKDNAYKARVKELTFELGLVEKKDVKLFTQMDTSTIFYRYCEREFLKPGGIIAFVMPKTTILPSKQHIGFQEGGVSEIHDFSGVAPLFNVRAVVLIHKSKDARTSDIPITYYEGNLPLKNVALKVAQKCFDVVEKDTYAFLDSHVRSPHYHKKFLQGATIVPRCFWFVQPASKAAYNIDAPFFETSDDTKEEAKKPWIVTLHGRIEKEFLFETVLAKGLLPFAIYRRELVFLPLKIRGGETILVDSEHLLSEGKEHAVQWMQETEKIWNQKRASGDRSIYQRLDYNSLLSRQKVHTKTVVLYNTSGTNLTAALFTPTDELMNLKINGFVADAKTYYYYPQNIKEGDYLCSILNSNVVNEHIKAYQPEGLYGARDIHRRPFEVCPIPLFDEDDSEHIRLSELGRECRQTLRGIAPKMEGGIGRMRLETRRIIDSKISEINKIVESILQKHGQDKSLSVLWSALRKKKKAMPLFD